VWPVGGVAEHRLRDQLMFFVPKAVGVTMTISALAIIGIDVTGMAAVTATVGFTGAVVFTPVGQNLVAGAMIRIDHIYQVGEVVTIGDLHGVVLYRSMLRTELALPDGSTAWIPNSLFQENQVLNHSRMGAWRVCLQVPLDRSTDRQAAITIMDRVVRDLSWSAPNRTAFVAFDQVGAEAMFFNAYAWITDRTEEPFYRGLLLNELVDALEAEGISVGQTTNLSINPSQGPEVGAGGADPPRPFRYAGPSPGLETPPELVAAPRQSRWRLSSLRSASRRTAERPRR
jgi:small-conductance mechanosensitive channel